MIAKATAYVTSISEKEKFGYEDETSGCQAKSLRHVISRKERATENLRRPWNVLPDPSVRGILFWILWIRDTPNSAISQKESLQN